MPTPEVRFRSLYDAHGASIRRYCARRVDAAAVDDAVAETFAIAWRKLADVPNGDRALAWLYAVAHRVVYHEWRSAGRWARVQDRVGELAGGGASDPADEFLERGAADLALVAVGHLPEAEREILLLTVWEELSVKQAARVLGISYGAARQRAHRARRRLGRAYRELEASGERLVGRGGTS